MISSHLKPTFLIALLLIPFTTFALPTTNPSYGITQLASRQNGQVHVAQYDKTTQEIVCMITGIPNKCMLRTTQLVAGNAFFTVYDHDCKSLSLPDLTGMIHPNAHFSTFSELRYSVELYYTSGNWNEMPLLKYAAGSSGASLGNAICVDTGDPGRVSCLIPFDC